MNPELRTAFIDRNDNNATHTKQVKFSVLGDGSTMIEFFIGEGKNPSEFLPNGEMDDQGYRCLLLFYGDRDGSFTTELNGFDGDAIYVPSVKAFVTDAISGGKCYAPTMTAELDPVWAGHVPEGFARLVVIKPHRWEHEAAKFGPLASSFHYGSGPLLLPRHLLCLPAAVKEWRELTEYMALVMPKTDADGPTM